MLSAEASAARPLYMQLAEREEEKKQEYDAMTKKMFAPPKALDEEDLAFLAQVQQRKDGVDRRRSEDDKKAIAAFRTNKSSSVAPAPSQLVHPAKKENKPTAAPGNACSDFTRVSCV